MSCEQIDPAADGSRLPILECGKLIFTRYPVFCGHCSRMKYHGGVDINFKVEGGEHGPDRWTVCYVQVYGPWSV